MENFSKSDDDIVNILDRANQYMTDPLKTVINDFVMDVRLYADMKKSFEKLCRKLDKTKLSDVFRSIQICSEHDSNYTEVIEDAKSSVKQYMSSKTIQKAIINSARADMAALVIAGIMIIKILNSFLSEDVAVILFSSYIGIGIMVYCVIILCLAVYFLFWR